MPPPIFAVPLTPPLILVPLLVDLLPLAVSEVESEDETLELEEMPWVLPEELPSVEPKLVPLLKDCPGL